MPPSPPPLPPAAQSHSPDVEARAPAASQFRKRARPASSKARKRPRPAAAPAADPESAPRHLRAAGGAAHAARARRAPVVEPRFSAGGAARSGAAEAVATNALSGDGGGDADRGVGGGVGDGRTEGAAAAATAAAATAGRSAAGGLGARTKRAQPYGPLAAPRHLRASVRVDYQPDVCKDYKETGYCGFGDACKFLHDRSDYASGWQLERDWAARRAARQQAALLRGEDGGDAADGDADADADADANAEAEAEAGVDDEGLPFACFVCRQAFTRPVVTRCAHYFCEDCALGLLGRDAACAVCGKSLDGTFNSATRLAARLSARGARASSAAATRTE